MIENYLGVKFEVVIAGFLAGFISLTFVRRLNFLGGFMALAGAGICAHYGTPVVVAVPFFNGISEGSVGFIVGLFGMNILAGVFGLSQRFRASPLETLELLRKIRNGTKNEE